MRLSRRPGHGHGRDAEAEAEPSGSGRDRTGTWNGPAPRGYQVEPMHVGARKGGRLGFTLLVGGWSVMEGPGGRLGACVWVPPLGPRAGGLPASQAWTRPAPVCLPAWPAPWAPQAQDESRVQASKTVNDPPHVLLPGGTKMPLLGLGTYKLQSAEAVKKALEREHTPAMLFLRRRSCDTFSNVGSNDRRWWPLPPLAQGSPVPRLSPLCRLQSGTATSTAPPSTATKRPWGRA